MIVRVTKQHNLRASTSLGPATDPGCEEDLTRPIYKPVIGTICKLEKVGRRRWRPVPADSIEDALACGHLVLRSLAVEMTSTPFAKPPRKEGTFENRRISWIVETENSIYRVEAVEQRESK